MQESRVQGVEGKGQKTEDRRQKTEKMVHGSQFTAKQKM